jgi:Bacterial PH domain
MTDASNGQRTLPLQPAPSNLKAWTIVIAFGVPVVIILASFAFAFATTKPAGPVWIAPLVALIACAIATLAILRIYRRIGVTLERDVLVVATGVTTRRFALSSLRAGGVRVVSLQQHPDLRPVVRTWGIGAPGLASGWFRLRNGAKALCIVTGRERVTALRSDDGTSLLLSLVDAAVLRDALGSDNRGLKPTL